MVDFKLKNQIHFIFFKIDVWYKQEVFYGDIEWLMLLFKQNKVTKPHSELDCY